MYNTTSHKEAIVHVLKVYSLNFYNNSIINISLNYDVNTCTLRVQTFRYLLDFRKIIRGDLDTIPTMSGLKDSLKIYDVIIYALNAVMPKDTPLPKLLLHLQMS